MCVSTFLPCQPDLSAFYGQRSTFIPTPTAVEQTKLTTVSCQETAVITQIHQDFGFLDFTVNEECHRNTLVKNGAARLPANTGKLFFHASRLFGCNFDELEVGTTVRFNVLHNKKINKYIADSVQMVEDMDFSESEADTESYEMHYQMDCEVSNLTSTKEMLKAQAVKLMRRVSITVTESETTTTNLNPEQILRKLSATGEALLAGLSQQMQELR